MKREVYHDTNRKSACVEQVTLSDGSKSYDVVACDSGDTNVYEYDATVIRIPCFNKESAVELAELIDKSRV